jgi:hypothetical protein
MMKIALSLQAELDRAQPRNRTEFYTGDESRVLWQNFPKGYWLSLDKELPERGHQTIGPEKSMLTGFNPNGFAIVDLLPQRDSFTAQCFIYQILKPLSQEHSTKSADLARISLWLQFENSR